ncbi:MAG TPA: outer membrane protein assembly factor BamE [Sphingomonadaceae bacterium]|nr:outer membrane protein assembly factor BamE [Sphingomonadaceae bacterium]
MRKGLRIWTGLAAGALVAGCSSIADHRGYISDPTLIDAVQPGIDNQTSVEGTLGHPTFTSQFGEPTWYYISSTTSQKPFTRPKIRQHAALEIKFDSNGNVSSVNVLGIDQVAYLSPEGDKTPTLGKERGFLEDLFGNIGQVGSFGGGAAGPGGS